ncbi:hypothetical protein EV697_10566 [Bisgaardia hudsonensis]|uniref:HicA-like toxin of HicAB toxin-antitoxin system n=1 Tax=Bisgaardia hudsonensis TaxID=109472 RepID=A0A4R2MTT4_9PAST|nr:hypothetical protein A6A11_08390 [Bisgaardia hudsonensis]TCP11954.1 hypothetical protein EV697_10566 [Bisgaardia hudsonensis]
MRTSNNKDIRAYIHKLIKNKNIQINIKNGKKHAYLLIQKHKIIIPSTPSCKYSYNNFKRDVEKILKIIP